MASGANTAKNRFLTAVSYGFLAGVALFAAYLITKRDFVLLAGGAVMLVMSVLYLIGKALAKKRPDKEARERARSVRPQKDLLDN